jgi:hypothetical protein
VESVDVEADMSFSFNKTHLLFEFVNFY